MLSCRLLCSGVAVTSSSSSCNPLHVIQSGATANYTYSKEPFPWAAGKVIEVMILVEDTRNV